MESKASSVSATTTLSAAQELPLDVVWLKRDVRLSDHGPLSAVAPRKDRQVIILYCYEPDQLRESTVHGSHIRFINEGLLDLDRRVHNNLVKTTTTTLRGRNKGLQDEDEDEKECFRVLTVCYGEITATLQAIHDQYAPIKRLLAHQETGHMESFRRDKRVRKWCRKLRIPFVEFPQTGATRCLKDRDDYSKHWHQFMNRMQHAKPQHFFCHLVAPAGLLPGRVWRPLCEELKEIPSEHRGDRSNRQCGGETKALEVLDSFLHHRGCNFSSGISSPNSCWTTGSRLSPYLAWGHISLRYVVQATRQRALEIKQQRHSRDNANNQRWSRSLTAFASRLHWRSHFIQKLESEPEMELRDLSPAYQHLRRQPGDWNAAYYKAWTTGNTGFPFVDACMRCLERHGWLNFRMRAMLVSFATYNLWLDWKRIAPHLARVFLDYEPGIHYPQLQMQSGTTGINAMRVYSVTKQGKDQDPDGVFIRKHVSELQRVPKKYIHEPWKMNAAEQRQYGVVLSEDYPTPIVDEKESAKISKQRVAEIRNSQSAKREAQQVYQKHGSRTSRENAPGRPRKTSKKGKDTGQMSIKTMLASPANSNSAGRAKAPLPNQLLLRNSSPDCKATATTATFSSAKPKSDQVVKATAGQRQTSIAAMFSARTTSEWNCQACTFLNAKVHALVCSMCGTARNTRDAHQGPN